MKQTTIESQRDGNLTGQAGAGSSKHTLHHTQDAKTTMKETTIEQTTEQTTESEFSNQTYPYPKQKVVAAMMTDWRSV